ncbi:unnamed protein product, partial [Iphiclides podalirius]
MQHFENSITLKDFIINVVAEEKKEHENALDFIAKMIGEAVRKMHESNIIHGDLTTSNMLLVEKTPNDPSDDTRWFKYDNVEFAMIDFGLSYIDNSAEDKGVDFLFYADIVAGSS